MFRLRLGGLERLEALDELAPERLERRVPGLHLRAHRARGVQVMPLLQEEDPLLERDPDFGPAHATR